MSDEEKMITLEKACKIASRDFSRNYGVNCIHSITDCGDKWNMVADFGSVNYSGGGNIFVDKSTGEITDVPIEYEVIAMINASPELEVPKEYILKK